MKHIILLTAILSLFFTHSATAQNIPGTNLVEKTFELNIVSKDKPSLSLEQLVVANDRLNTYIGSYPPQFKDEAERQVIYKAWLRFVSEAEAYAKTHNGTEEAFFLLADFYRQGHNMDVIGSAEKSIENLEACLKAYEKSETCNLSASYLYLSIGVDYLERAEDSLVILRKLYKPRIDHEVESGYVFLYLYKLDADQAIKQIKFFIKEFPLSNRTEMFQLILPDLEKDGITFKQE
jgi:hypothetical protein